MKNGTISSRVSVVQRSKGQSAVEQSAYISRTSLYSDYCGMTYNRTGKEDLVSSGVLLPESAPPEFQDRAVLWNSVETFEKSKNAQLARSLKYSLPNEWGEQTAKRVMEEFIAEQFVSKGMCADYGIHRSFNERGQPNLHVHILLTMRPLNEDGTWGDPRSYQEREIPLIPTIHLGEKASALERRGIHTERGNINRAIREYNSLIMKIYEFISELKTELKKSLFRLTFGKEKESKEKVSSIHSSNEVRRALEFLQSRIPEITVRPIFPYVQQFKDSRSLSNLEKLAAFIEREKLDTWEDVRAFEERQTGILKQCRDKLAALNPEYQKWTQALADYGEYKQLQPVMKEYQALKGLRKSSFRKKHGAELEIYENCREKVKAVMPEGMKLSKPYLDRKLTEVQEKQKEIQTDISRVTTELARLSVFKGNLREQEHFKQSDVTQKKQERGRNEHQI